jgi:hypothetical protein
MSASRAQREKKGEKRGKFTAGEPPSDGSLARPGDASDARS